MKIEFTKVTWYSRIGSVLLFLAIIPVLTFYIGRQYEQTIAVLDSNVSLYSK